MNSKKRKKDHKHTKTVGLCYGARMAVPVRFGSDLFHVVFDTLQPGKIFVRVQSGEVKYFIAMCTTAPQRNISIDILFKYKLMPASSGVKQLTRHVIVALLRHLLDCCKAVDRKSQVKILALSDPEEVLTKISDKVHMIFKDMPKDKTPQQFVEEYATSHQMLISTYTWLKTMDDAMNMFKMYYANKSLAHYYTTHLGVVETPIEHMDSVALDGIELEGTVQGVLDIVNDGPHLEYMLPILECTEHVAALS